MKEIIHKISLVAQAVFVITNFLTLGTKYWHISMLLWTVATVISISTF